MNLRKKSQILTGSSRVTVENSENIWVDNTDQSIGIQNPAYTRCGVWLSAEGSLKLPFAGDTDGVAPLSLSLFAINIFLWVKEGTTSLFI
jgi:hypothetical protein